MSLAVHPLIRESVGKATQAQLDTLYQLSFTDFSKSILESNLIQTSGFGHILGKTS
jgi:hypothetical protein